jgi:hypothetical protein
MARRLKAYQTSSGFFDLAIAAPSMKAAAEAWGSRTNIFKQGFAKETRDPKIVTATMAKPGVVLKRPVGSNEAFREHAHLPKHLPAGRDKEAPAKPQLKPREAQLSKIDDKAARVASVAFERAQARREAERRREEAKRQKERELRERKVRIAERALEKAERQHEAKAKEIERERTALDKRSQAENARWQKQKEKLESARSRARGDNE